MSHQLIPLFDQIIVIAEAKEEVRASGIVLPDTASKERPQIGEVIAVGPDCKAVKKGDKVAFKTYSPTEFKMKDKKGNEQEYLILKEEDLLAKVA